MAALTFEQLRAQTQSSSLSTQEKERLQIEVALAEHMVKALDRLQGAVVLAGMASAGIAAFAGTTKKTRPLGEKLEPEQAVQHLADLAKKLELL